MIWLCREYLTSISAKLAESIQLFEYRHSYSAILHLYRHMDYRGRDFVALTSGLVADYGNTVVVAGYDLYWNECPALLWSDAACPLVRTATYMS